MNTLRLAHVSVLFFLLSAFSAGVSADHDEHHEHHGHWRGHHGHHHHDHADYGVRYYYPPPPPPVVIHRHYHPAPPPPPVYYQRDDYGDYGVRSGRCDNHTAAQVLGGVAGGALGGALGSGMSDGNGIGAVVGVVAGSVLGAVIGERVGEMMDPTDRFCAGRALDFAQDRQGVNWFNPQSRIGYQLMPLQSFRQDGMLCREFTTSAAGYGDGRQVACRLPNGDWDIRS
ncbi:hypothetical protein [Methylococcus sp. EFPC2]|uniref:hypothetical protein n=1 Tax=Methylococcus sp. EFPC2 TaxID=2812648 RepID=UPI0019684965|nr:hypothetical protein [Methylococcus sp. EFPC2]QSA97982.1 hypothetical protein JWZ97_03900 [Methylococcus sp. EFPC2]